MIDVKKSVRERVGAKDQQPVAHGVGRRKTAVARVWCYYGNGTLEVNGQEIDQYFDTITMREAATMVCSVVPNIARHYKIKVNVRGGGKNAQADAMKLGIARAFLEKHEDIKDALRLAGKLLTRDSRRKERKKPGQKAARRKFQFVKR